MRRRSHRSEPFSLCFDKWKGLLAQRDGPSAVAGQPAVPLKDEIVQIAPGLRLRRTLYLDHLIFFHIENFLPLYLIAAPVVLPPAYTSVYAAVHGICARNRTPRERKFFAAGVQPSPPLSRRMRELLIRITKAPILWRKAPARAGITPTAARIIIMRLTEKAMPMF